MVQSIEEMVRTLFIDLEQTAFNNQQMDDPGNIGRSLQHVLDDACAAWRCCDHRKGVKGSREAPAGLLSALPKDAVAVASVDAQNDEVALGRSLKDAGCKALVVRQACRGVGSWDLRYGR